MDYNQPLLPEKYYHIYNHAVGDENIFRSADNYKYFLTRYGDYIQPVASSYAYCLLPNHFHFLIKLKSESALKAAFDIKYKDKVQKPPFQPSDFVMQCFSNLFNAYAKAYNNKYERKGALFLDYMRRKEVEHENYYANLVHYIHYNAVHHGLCENIEDWDFTSYQTHLSNKPTRLQRAEVIQWFNGREEMIKRQHQPPANLWSGLEF